LAGGYHRRVGLVIFDLDNTLVDRDLSFRRWAAELVDLNGLDPTTEKPWLVAADGDGFVAREEFLADVLPVLTGSGP
jgi:FMN phosphatase YigB (HAD superfamily)